MVNPHWQNKMKQQCRGKKLAAVDDLNLVPPESLCPANSLKAMQDIITAAIFLTQMYSICHNFQQFLYFKR